MAGGGTQFQASQQPPTGSPQSAQDKDLELARGVIENFQRAGGMTVDQIKQTPSYKKLEAAGQAPTLV